MWSQCNTNGEILRSVLVVIWLNLALELHDPKWIKIESKSAKTLWDLPFYSHSLVTKKPQQYIYIHYLTKKLFVNDCS